MEFQRRLEEYVNSGDPVIRTFPLIRETYTPLILCVCYALFSTVVGPALMRNRKPFDLRKVLIVFNFSLVSVYLVCFIISCYNLTQLTWEQFCIKGSVEEGDPTYKMFRIAWMVYLLKYIEFLDTVFFILRKKSHLVTFLHVLHHFTVPLIAWFILRTERNGFLAIPGLLNTFVHIVMYSYYGLAAMGPMVRKYLWWKKYLTQLQLVQFVLIMFTLVVMAPVLGCTVRASSKGLAYFFVPLFFFLFLNFYLHSFGSSLQKSKDNFTSKSQNGKDNFTFKSQNGKDR